MKRKKNQQHQEWKKTKPENNTVEQNDKNNPTTSASVKPVAVKTNNRKQWKKLEKGKNKQSNTIKKKVMSKKGGGKSNTKNQETSSQEKAIDFADDISCSADVIPFDKWIPSTTIQSHFQQQQTWATRKSHRACFFFQQGKCMKNEKCSFSHDLSQQAERSDTGSGSEIHWLKNWTGQKSPSRLTFPNSRGQSPSNSSASWNYDGTYPGRDSGRSSGKNWQQTSNRHQYDDTHSDNNPNSLDRSHRNYKEKSYLLPTPSASYRGSKEFRSAAPFGDNQGMNSNSKTFQIQIDSILNTHNPPPASTARKKPSENEEIVRKDQLKLSLKADKLIDSILNKKTLLVDNSITDKQPDSSSEATLNRTHSNSLRSDTLSNRYSSIHSGKKVGGTTAVVRNSKKGKDVTSDDTDIIKRAELMCKLLRDKRQMAESSSNETKPSSSYGRNEKTRNRTRSGSADSLDGISSSTSSTTSLSLTQSATSTARRFTPGALPTGISRLTGDGSSHGSKLQSRSVPNLSRKFAEVKDYLEKSKHSVSVHGPDGRLMLEKHRKSDMFGKDSLTKLVNSPRSRKDRMQVTKYLNVYNKQQHKHRPVLRLGNPVHDLDHDQHPDLLESHDVSFDNLPDEIQIQVKELIDTFEGIGGSGNRGVNSTADNDDFEIIDKDSFDMNILMNSGRGDERSLSKQDSCSGRYGSPPAVTSGDSLGLLSATVTADNQDAIGDPLNIEDLCYSSTTTNTTTSTSNTDSFNTEINLFANSNNSDKQPTAMENSTRMENSTVEISPGRQAKTERHSSPPRDMLQQELNRNTGDVSGGEVQPDYMYSSIQESIDRYMASDHLKSLISVSCDFSESNNDGEASTDPQATLPSAMGNSTITENSTDPQATLIEITPELNYQEDAYEHQDMQNKQVQHSNRLENYLVENSTSLVNSSVNSEQDFSSAMENPTSVENSSVEISPSKQVLAMDETNNAVREMDHLVTNLQTPDIGCLDRHKNSTALTDGQNSGNSSLSTLRGSDNSREVLSISEQNPITLVVDNHQNSDLFSTSVTSMTSERDPMTQIYELSLKENEIRQSIEDVDVDIQNLQTLLEKTQIEITQKKALKKQLAGEESVLRSRRMELLKGAVETHTTSSNESIVTEYSNVSTVENNNRRVANLSDGNQDSQSVIASRVDVYSPANVMNIVPDNVQIHQPIQHDNVHTTAGGILTISPLNSSRTHGEMNSRIPRLVNSPQNNIEDRKESNNNSSIGVSLPFSSSGDEVENVADAIVVEPTNTTAIADSTTTNNIDEGGSSFIYVDVSSSPEKTSDTMPMDTNTNKATPSPNYIDENKSRFRNVNTVDKVDSGLLSPDTAGPATVQNEYQNESRFGNVNTVDKVDSALLSPDTAGPGTATVQYMGSFSLPETDNTLLHQIAENYAELQHKSYIFLDDNIACTSPNEDGNDDFEADEEGDELNDNSVSSSKRRCKSPKRRKNNKKRMVAMDSDEKSSSSSSATEETGDGPYSSPSHKVRRKTNASPVRPHAKLVKEYLHAESSTDIEINGLERCGPKK